MDKSRAAGCERFLDRLGQGRGGNKSASLSEGSVRQRGGDTIPIFTKGRGGGLEDWLLKGVRWTFTPRGRLAIAPALCVKRQAGRSRQEHNR
ncbi:hypothetical protein VTH06DRAFT_2422 [Thermothelomyces fergusii]